MQYFYIKRGATLPTLRMELVLEGKYDYWRSYNFNNAIQNADVTFSMYDEHNVLCISKAPCNIILSQQTGCEEKYFLEYEWQKRDTLRPGQYKGTFDINFHGDIYEADNTYQSGLLRAPIYEELVIQVL